jgi:hypothetical protein
MAIEVHKHIATFCAIERDITRRSFEQWLRAKPSFVGKKGTPRDIVSSIHSCPARG